MTSLERLLPLDVRHAFRFRFCSRIFVVNLWVMNYDSYDQWSHDFKGLVISGHVINAISVIKKHNFDFSITTRMEDPTLKILELIRQSNFHNFWSGIQEPLVGPFRTSAHIWNWKTHPIADFRTIYMDKFSRNRPENWNFGKIFGWAYQNFPIRVVLNMYRCAEANQ